MISKAQLLGHTDEAPLPQKHMITQPSASFCQLYCYQSKLYENHPSKQNNTKHFAFQTRVLQSPSQTSDHLFGVFWGFWFVFTITFFMWMCASQCEGHHAYHLQETEEGTKSSGLEIQAAVSCLTQCWELNSDSLSHLSNPLSGLFLRSTKQSQITIKAQAFTGPVPKEHTPELPGLPETSVPGIHRHKKSKRRAWSMSLMSLCNDRWSSNDLYFLGLWTKHRQYTTEPGKSSSLGEKEREALEAP